MEYFVGKRKPVEQLTAKEVEVLSLLVDGYQNAEIGKMLNITKNTVEIHCNSIMLRLRIHDLAGLVKYALKHNITTLDKHRDDPRYQPS